MTQKEHTKIKPEGNQLKYAKLLNYQKPQQIFSHLKQFKLHEENQIKLFKFFLNFIFNFKFFSQKILLFLSQYKVDISAVLTLSISQIRK